jgi:DNA topoisomerase III
MTKVLCVAEKPSIAKAVSQILSGGRLNVHNTGNKYIKNHKFTSRFPEWGECEVVFTSVLGHLTEIDFDSPWRKWNTCSPDALFEEAMIVQQIPKVHILECTNEGLKGHSREYCSGKSICSGIIHLDGL